MGVLVAVAVGLGVKRGKRGVAVCEGGCWVSGNNKTGEGLGLEIAAVSVEVGGRREAFGVGAGRQPERVAITKNKATSRFWYSPCLIRLLLLPHISVLNPIRHIRGHKICPCLTIVGPST